MRLFSDVSLRGSCETAISFPHLEGMTVSELDEAAEVFRILRQYALAQKTFILCQMAGDTMAATMAERQTDRLYDDLVKTGVYSQRRIANENAL